MAAVSPLAQLETTLEDIFARKAPALPKGVKDFIVTVGPWVTAILMLMLLPVVLAAFGLGAMFMPFGFVGGLDSGLMYTIGLVTSGVTLVLQALSLPGLFKRQLSGWRLAFYASLASLVGGVLQMQLISALIGAVISWYFIFQIKSYYK